MWEYCRFKQFIIWLIITYRLYRKEGKEIKKCLK